jgi:hypothetical protein
MFEVETSKKFSHFCKIIYNFFVAVLSLFFGKKLYIARSTSELVWSIEGALLQ